MKETEKRKEIPELLLRCCGKIHKPHSIKLIDNYVEITFFCPICRNWIYLECKNGLDTKIYKIDSNNKNNHVPFKYHKGV